MLCQATLPLLKRHGFPLEQVHVFVSPERATDSEDGERYRYLTALRREGFEKVNLDVGRDGLEHQMHAIFKWAQGGYLVVMTDDVKDVLERKTPRTRKQSPATLTTLPLGMLRALFLHGRDLLHATDCFAWSLNCSQNLRSMDETKISRRFGLLNGSLAGFRLEGNPEDWRVAHGLGIVFDVALSCNLWSTGRLFCRYRGLCLEHRYRASGGYQSTLQLQARREKEDEAIGRLEETHPNLIKFHPKPNATLCTMQYQMLKQGAGPLTLKAPVPVTGGRRFEGFADRAMTAAERQRRCRDGKSALSAT